MGNSSLAFQYLLCEQAGFVRRRAVSVAAVIGFYLKWLGEGSVGGGVEAAAVSSSPTT